MSLKDKERPDDLVINEAIAQAIRDHLKDDRLACAPAFVIARDHKIEPLDVGQTADALDIHLSRCQLGLFGYPQKQAWPTSNVAQQPVPEGLETALKEAAGHHQQLACAEAWRVAARFKVSKLLVGYLADQLGLHITPCQLGAF